MSGTEGMDVDPFTIHLMRLTLARRNEAVTDEKFIDLIRSVVIVAIKEFKINSIAAFRELQQVDHVTGHGIDDLRACPWCGTEVASMRGHRCERMRELGLGDAPRDNAQTCELPDDYIGGHETSSTGAATDRPSAEHTTNPDTAASAPSSAPSIDTASRSRPLPESPGAALSRDSAESAAATQHAAETPRAHGMRERDADIRAEYEAERAESQRLGLRRMRNGVLQRLADKYGVSVKRVKNIVADLSSESLAPPPSEPAAPPAAETAVARLDDAGRVHANSHGCWCRKKPCNTKNPWCAIAKPSKPIPFLSSPESRADRYRAHRVRD